MILSDPVPDPQGFVKLPQGHANQVRWIPIKAKERVWVRCGQDVCTHGMDATEEPEDDWQEGGVPQGPCYFFDDLPEVAGHPTLKGRWVEKDVDLLEGGKYTWDCIREMDEEGVGLNGQAWPRVKGWKMRLERNPLWER